MQLPKQCNRNWQHGRAPEVRIASELAIRMIATLREPGSSGPRSAFSTVVPKILRAKGTERATANIAEAKENPA